MKNRNKITYGIFLIAIISSMITLFYNDNKSNLYQSFSIDNFINSAMAQDESSSGKAAYKQEGSGHSKITYESGGKTCVEEYDWERVVCPGNGNVTCTPMSKISNRTVICS